jgi:hypothetical protein
MLEKTPDHDQRPKSDARPVITLGALAFARTVAAEFVKLETGYRNGLYDCIGKALTSYRKFLKDPADYEELLGEANIKGLPEKPEVQVTSRLVLYFHTGAKTDAQRNTAGKYARIVDYLHKERVENAAAAAERIRKAGGIVEILKEARKGQALKVAEDTQQADDQDFEREDEFEEAAAFSSTSTVDEIFDPEKDLAIRLKRETLAKVLGSQIPTNELFYLECRKTGSLGHGGVLIEGRLFDQGSE